MLKYMKLFVALAVIACFAFQCDEDETIISNSWRVAELHLTDQDTTIIPDAEYIIIFNPDNTYSINLDINNCFGDFKITGEDQIDIGNGGCTEACCDSELAIEIFEKIMASEQYFVSQNDLNLSSDGYWIDLIRVD